MKPNFLFFAAIGLLISCGMGKKNNPEDSTTATQVTLNLIRQTNNLPAAESVVYDESKDLLYVSCQGADVPGDGTIARVSLDGEILDVNFVTGLNDPKGIAIAGDKLYVGDLLELVEIDRETGRVLNKYTDQKIRFLNDVTVDDAGNVYVSDMFTSSIYILDAENNFSEWFASPDMDNPNGLLAINDEIYLAGWGKFTDGQPLAAPQGRFQKINIKTKEITTITPEVLGNLDGIQVIDENRFFVSDWKAGKIFIINKNGESAEVLDIDQGSGDILYLPGKNLLVIPMSFGNQILFYSMK
jgi:sugar lactone lactonase YvrE